MIAVGDAAGGEWGDRARAAAVALVADSKETEPSLGIRLLNDLRIVFGDAKEMSSKSVLQALHAIEESPWADIKGKPLDERGLSHRLRQYAIKSKTVRIAAATFKGYTRADLVDVWKRYLPSSAMSVTSVTSDTLSEGGHGLADTTPSVQQKEISEINDVSVVSDVTDLGGGGRRCDHCATAVGELCEASVGGKTVWLHADCVKAYRAAP